MNKQLSQYKGKVEAYGQSDGSPFLEKNPTASSSYNE